jgi:hypothetical protein
MITPTADNEQGKKIQKYLSINILRIETISHRLIAAGKKGIQI